MQFILEDVAVEIGFGICSAVDGQADDGVIALPVLCKEGILQGSCEGGSEGSHP